MFRASRGQGGSGSGANNSNRKRRVVDPQSAIVVANKMTAVVQGLQDTNKQTVEQVVVQVRKNTENIKDLYNQVYQHRKNELEVEKAESTRATKTRESLLRKAKEGLVEGVSSATAGIINLGSKLAKAALSPVRGLWDRIASLLSTLAAAWAIDNLPKIVGYIEDFLSSVPDIKSKFTDSLGSIRGVWSILDDLLGGVKKAIGRVARTAFKVGRFIFQRSTELIKKILSSVKNFVGDVIGGVVRGVKKILKDALPKLRGGLTKPKKPPTPKGPSGGNKPPKPTIKPSGSGGGFGSWLQKQGKRFTDFGNKVLSKGSELLDGGKRNIGNALGRIQTGMTGIKPQSEAKRIGWLQKALAPLQKTFPAMKGAFGGLTKLAKGIFKVVPGLGFAIDLALNKSIAGQDWTEAVVRALGSSITGGISAFAGAKVGGLAGAAIGAPLAGIGAIPGAAIGAALGAIIAGMVGGAAGDTVGAGAYEFITGKPATENKPMGSGVVETVSSTLTSAKPLGSPGENTGPRSFDLEVSGSKSTPDGMSIPDSVSNSFDTSVIELPPIVTKIPAENKQQQSLFNETVDQSTEIPITDPDMDVYRAFSARAYQLIDF